MTSPRHAWSIGVAIHGLDSRRSLHQMRVRYALNRQQKGKSDHETTVPSQLHRRPRGAKSAKDDFVI